MAIIVNPSWKSKKVDEEVEFKGVTYTMGSDAFATIEAAVAAGNTSDLVIVDKKLTSPVKDTEIESAATDIFASTDTGYVLSKDGKTATRTIKFTAAAGGTATMKKAEDLESLNGFEKVTVTAADAGDFTFFGGKQDASLSAKDFDDEDKVQESEDITATYTSTATGSLTVNGKAENPSAVTVAGIEDSESGLVDVIGQIGDIYSIAATEPGAENPEIYVAPIAASYTSVTLTNVTGDSAFNGGSNSEKATLKTSSAEDASGLVKSSEDYSYSFTGKVGSGTATLTDAGSGALIGFKTTKITVKNGNGITVGEVAGGNHNESYTLKKAYQEEVSASNNWSSTKAATVAGNLTATGKAGKMVNIAGIMMESSVNLKYANVDGDDLEIELGQGNSKITENTSVKKQGEDYALTYDYSSNITETVGGTLKAENSIIGAVEIDGVKDLTVTNSTIINAEAWNEQETETRKVTGFSDAGVIEDISLADVDWGMSFSDTWSQKETTTAAGTATLTDSVATTLYGFKTVTVNAKKGPANGGAILGGNTSEDETEKSSYVVEKSSGYEETTKVTRTASGTVSVTGIKTIQANAGSITGFSSVNLKYASTGDIKTLNNNQFNTFTTATKIALAAKNDDTVTYSYTDSTDTVISADGSVTASNSILGNIGQFKTVTLTDSRFGGASAVNSKSSIKTTRTGYTAELTPDAQGAQLDLDQAYTTEVSMKDETSLGGTSFKYSGKVQEGQVAAAINGYKSVSLENKDQTPDVYLQGNLTNTVSSNDITNKVSFEPDKSKSVTQKSTVTSKAEGDATFKGQVTGRANGFASVKSTGTTLTEQGTYNAWLSAVNDNAATGLTRSNVTNMTKSVKADKDAYLGDYSSTETVSSKTTTTVDASKTTLYGYGAFNNLKTAKLQNVRVFNASFSNGLDVDSSVSRAIKWNADNLDDDDVPEDIMAHPEFIEKMTSANITGSMKETVVGDFTLKNDKDSQITGLGGITNFKNVDITVVKDDVYGIQHMTVAHDTTGKESLKYTATEAKKTLDFSVSETETAVGSLKVTGKSTTEGVTTLEIGETENATLDYATITLKDAVINGNGAVANAYAVSSSATISESQSFEDDSATVKFTRKYSKVGNGKFTASVAKPVNDTPATVFSGELNGYGTISLTNVSIGSVDNFKVVGDDDPFAVPFNGEFFDVFMGPPAPDAVLLEGDITGSYTVDKNGQINSSWKSNYSTTASGSFTQTAKTAGAEAGAIAGYDSVTLTGVAFVTGDIDGSNTETNRELTYKTVDDEAVIDLDVTTERNTSSSSVKLTGKKIGVLMQKIETGDIEGYKSVTLDNAIVEGISAIDNKTVTTVDGVAEFMTVETTTNSIGSLTASESTINGEVRGFQTVKLTNTAADVIFQGGFDFTATRTDVTGVQTTDWERKTVGSFTAEDTRKNPAAYNSIHDISGYQTVKLTDYSADIVDQNQSYVPNMGASSGNYVKVTLADEEKETPEIVQGAGSTKGNSLTATAKKNENMAVGYIQGYAKVEATGLKSIGTLDTVVVYDEMDRVHYGEWTATKVDGEFTAIASDTSSASVKITGVAATKTADARLTEVTAGIAGFGTATLKNVKITGQDSYYAAGKYDYTTKTNKDDDVIATSTSTSVGKLTISNAEAAQGAGIKVDLFKDVEIDISGANALDIEFINGGTTTTQRTNGADDYTAFAMTGKLTANTNGGTIGSIKGFDKVSLTDTSVGTLQGYAVEAKEIDDEWVTNNVGKATVTLENTKAEGNAIGSIDNAKSVTFKAAADDDVDFTLGSITSDAEDLDTKVLVDKCQTAMNLGESILNEGDEIKLTSTGEEDGNAWASIELTGLTQDSLATYFNNVEGLSISGKGTLLGGVSEEDFLAKVEEKGIKIGDNIAFQSTLA